jgi:hypothetical protein
MLEDWLARQDMNAEEGMGELVRAQAQGKEEPNILREGEHSKGQISDEP